MVRALERPDSDPTYLEFFGLRRAPFARISDPSEVFHTEQYSLLMAHLANATEQPDCLVVVCGADGSGKTTLLNRYVASLGDEFYCAKIDETCRSDEEFFCQFLSQLGFGEISGTTHELRRITKEFLIHRGLAGDTVLLIIDNAQMIQPTVLEQLRWLATIKVVTVKAAQVATQGKLNRGRQGDALLVGACFQPAE